VVTWDRVTQDDVLRALQEYDRTASGACSPRVRSRSRKEKRRGASGQPE
jgi:hypothetical protein